MSKLLNEIISYGISDQDQIIGISRSHDLTGIKLYVSTLHTIRIHKPVWRDAKKEEVPTEFLAHLTLLGIPFKFMLEEANNDSSAN